MNKPVTHSSGLEKVPGKGGARIRCLASVEPKELEWLWGGRIPSGKICDIAGDPGTGKSTMVTEIVAKLSNGHCLPGDSSACAAMNVLMLNAEDGVADTIVPRLVAAGADRTRVHILDYVVEQDGKRNLFNLRNNFHRKTLYAHVKKLEIGLIVVDPLNAYLGETNSWNDASVRGLLSPLHKLAEDSGVTVLVIRHLTKSPADKAIYRTGGSIGFTGAARCSLLVGQLDEDSADRAVCVIKSNLAAFPPAVGFRITEKGFEWSGERPDIRPADLLRPDASSEAITDRSETVEWLKAILANGEVPSTEVFKKARAELDVSESTVKRAKKSLRGTQWEIHSDRTSEGDGGEGQWVYRFKHSARGSEPGDTLGESSARKPNGVQGGQGHKGDPLAAQIDLTEDDEEYLQDEREGMAH